MTLRAEGVKVERGGRLALSAPDFQVKPGEAAVLTGPNGAGKSTLLRALAGFSPLAAGRVTLEGEEEPARQIALAGHHDAVKPALSVRENLSFWARIYGAGAGAGEKTMAALERFSLAHMASLPAAFCSAGQKRRLGLARLMLAGRRVWLLDEPTVSLNSASVEAFTALLREHCAAGGMAVAATHIAFGLPDGPRIALAPPKADAPDERDPFLAGAW